MYILIDVLARLRFDGTLTLLLPFHGAKRLTGVVECFIVSSDATGEDTDEMLEC